MDFSRAMRTIAPAVGIHAGAAVLGGAAAYGSIRVAGGDEGKAGMGTQLLGMLGGNPLVSGMVGGMAAWQVGGRLHGGKLLPGMLGAFTLPAGIAGAFLGARAARSHLEAAHREEYAAARTSIDETMERTRAVFADAGAGAAVLERVPERYDRSYFNASYQPPLGPFRNDIRIGRSAESGLPLSTDDVISHEFTHKVLHAYSPDLLGMGGSGDGRAIHESIADTFAMVVDSEDWLVGEDAIPGGIRSFSHPEVRGAMRNGEPRPAPITREQLEGGAEEHLGAGVGNKAAWRIGSALGRDEMARIYVAALERRELPRGATYADLATVVRAAAVDLYGPGSPEAAVVDDAWRQAGY